MTTPNCRHAVALCCAAAVTLAFALTTMTTTAVAQTPTPQRRPIPTIVDDPMTAQMVDSRKGYVARIPKEAVLDSAASGWSPEGLFERRVYRIPGAGEFRFTVTVKPQTIPDSATDNGSYVYTTTDSATKTGTAYVRTYYLPTRSVRIEIIPASIAMKRFIDARDKVFLSFRWKPGATTEFYDTDQGQLFMQQQRAQQRHEDQ